MACGAQYNGCSLYLIGACASSCVLMRWIGRIGRDIIDFLVEEPNKGSSVLFRYPSFTRVIEVLQLKTGGYQISEYWRLAHVWAIKVANGDFPTLNKHIPAFFLSHWCVLYLGGDIFCKCSGHTSGITDWWVWMDPTIVVSSLKIWWLIKFKLALYFFLFWDAITWDLFTGALRP